MRRGALASATAAAADSPALILPLLGLAAALGLAPLASVPALVAAVLLSELVLWALARHPRTRPWIRGRRYSTFEARRLPAPGPEAKRARGAVLRIHLALFLAATLALLVRVARETGHEGIGVEGGRVAIAWLAASVGALFAQAEVLGHELSHAPGGRRLTWLLYGAIGGYEGIGYHHHWHHRRFAETADELSLHFDRFYYGIVRRVSAQWRMTWKREPGRLLGSYLLLGGLVSATGVALGAPAALVYLLGLASGRAVAEALSVFSHYRLMRADFPEPHLASWETETVSLFDHVGGYRITRHAAHHARGIAREVRLEGAPELPGFLLAALACILCPPLFRRVMDRRLAAFAGRGPAQVVDIRQAADRVRTDAGPGFLFGH